MEQKIEVVHAVQDVEHKLKQKDIDYSCQFGHDNVCFFKVEVPYERFGCVGWDNNNNKLIYSAELLSVTARNIKEGFTEEQAAAMAQWIVFDDLSKFIDWMSGIKVEKNSKKS